MNKKSKCWYQYGLFLVVSIYLSLLFYKFHFYNDILWDSAVYVEMGKFIFSSGDSGIWESVRPPTWPIILGFLWKLGLNPIIYGKIITYILSTSTIIITYLIGRDLFDEKTALTSTILLAFIPTFFLANSQLMSSIPSTFFAITAVYFFIKQKYFYSGFISGIAFITRFLQLYVFIIFLVFVLVFNYKKRREMIKNYFSILKGFSIPTAVYLILNLILYKNPISPFTLQIYMAKYTGWPWWEPLTYYFKHLLKESYLIFFILAGLLYVVKNKEKKQMMIISLFLIYFIFYNLIIHKEMRFLIILMPYLSLITAKGITALTDMINNKLVAIFLIITLLLIFVTRAYPQYWEDPFNENYKSYYTYLNSQGDTGKILTTNPLYLLETNKRAQLIYYPTFDTSRAIEMQTEILNAKHILFNPCDIPCPPWEETCLMEKERFIRIIKDNFEEIYYKENNGCDYYIFTST